MKRLVYIFIPILAILLMSHNTFALSHTYNPKTCYHSASGTTCTTYPLLTADNIDVISVAKSNNLPNLQNALFAETFLWALNVRTNGTQPVQFDINLGNGYPEMATIDNIWQDCNTSNQLTSCNILVTGILRSADFNLQLAGQVWANGIQYHIESIYFSTDESQSNNLLFQLTQIRNYLRNNPEPTAQDIASAIENTAEQNTQNAANDSQTAGSSSSQDATTATSSLISAIGGFVGAVTNASPTNCVVNFTTSQLTIGNMDLCANPVPAYVQIIGSIILICAAIPLAIVLFNRFIGLFRSFQG